MPLNNTNVLACPIDFKPLQKTSKQLVCPTGHCFDIARQGYVNLLPVQYKKSKQPGDNKAMIEARRRFLNQGIYQIIADQFNQIVFESINLFNSQAIKLLDAACGEGYYLEQFHLKLKQHNAADNCKLIGMDISKPAIISASQHRSKQITWLVGTNKRPPIAENSIDYIFSLFGYPVFNSFKTILKKHGKILLAEAGENHLLELRQLIYEKVQKTPVPDLTAAEQQGFTLLNQSRLSKSSPTLNKQQIQDLLNMIPHVYRINTEQKQKLDNINTLKVTIDVVFRQLILIE